MFRDTNKEFCDWLDSLMQSDARKTPQGFIEYTIHVFYDKKQKIELIWQLFKSLWE